jgi:hypothetical protein
LYVGANSVSKRLWRQGITEIEIPERSFHFFNKFLPNLKEDEHFLGMEGKHETLMTNLAAATEIINRPPIIVIGHFQYTARPV